jgi:hypothetical protein
MKQKYIRFKKIDGINDVIIVFPVILDHKKFARQLGHDKEGIVSAGFVSICESEMGNPKYTCFGRSVSLDLESIPDEDARHLNYQLYETYDQDSF